MTSSNPNIIIGGHINSGKTTIANYLVSKYNYSKFSLGDGVKHFVSDLYSILHTIDPSISTIDINELYTEDRTIKEQHRLKMQLISTDLIKRYFGENIWIDYLFNHIPPTTSPFVIDDLRFKSEFNYLSNKPNTIYIRVVRPNELNYDHVSEHELDSLPPDYLIVNDRGMDHLYSQIDDIIIHHQFHS